MKKEDEKAWVIDFDGFELVIPCEKFCKVEDKDIQCRYFKYSNLERPRQGQDGAYCSIFNANSDINYLDSGLVEVKKNKKCIKFLKECDVTPEESE